MNGPLITVEELAARLAIAPTTHVLDASYLLYAPEFDGDYRGASARDRWAAEHIAGSRYVDVSTQFSDRSSPLHYTHPPAQAIAEELARLGIADGDPVIVYDSVGGLWAARLWYLLDWIGTPVRVLDGGLGAWSAAGLPTTSSESTPRPSVAPWTGRAVRDAWITKDELLARPAADSRPLVCALSADLFEGSATTRYARRGRIPGSLNLAARDLYSPDGRVRPIGELIAWHHAAGIPVDGTPVLLYCGGGISVSASALALAVVGVRDVRIYDGSLEEWAQDPTLELATGPAC